MEDPLSDYDQEFEELVGDALSEPDEYADPVTLGRMLFAIAEERKNTNLVVKNINQKFDEIQKRMEKYDALLDELENISQQLDELNEKIESEELDWEQIPNLSKRDREILEFVQDQKKVCADDIQKEFGYKGRNAASARLSKLFSQKILEKEYEGRKVYYKARS